MIEKTLADQIDEIINQDLFLEDSVVLSVLRSASAELKRQDIVIDFLYESLGPANDEILDMAYEAADEQCP